MKAERIKFDDQTRCPAELFREVLAWVLYGLSRVWLAPRPLYTTCILGTISCGYGLERNGFFRFPLYKLARKFEDELAQAVAEREVGVDAEESVT